MKEKRRYKDNLNGMTNVGESLESVERDLLLRRITVWGIFPVWILLVVLTLSPFTGDPSAPIKNLIISFWGFIGSIVVVWMAWYKGLEIKLKKSLSIFIGGYLCILMFSTIFAYNKGLAISEIVLWFTLCAVAFSIHILIREERELEWILLWVVIAIGLSSVYGFLQKFGIDPFPWSTRNVEEYRGLPSSYANPNFAGHALLFGVITSAGLTLYYFSLIFRDIKNNSEENSSSLRWNWIKLAISLVAFFLTFTHLYFTRMRSARIALLMSFCFALFYILYGHKWHPRRIIGFALGLSVVGVVLITIIFYILGMVGNESPLPFDNSLNLRLNGYYGAVKMILERPLLGYGPGNYRFANIPYWTNYEKLWFTLEKKRNYHVHCDPLEVLIDGGILAGVFYFGMILLGFVGGIYLYRNSNTKFGKYIGIAISSIFVAFASDAIFGFNIRVPVSSALFSLYLGLSQFMIEDEEIRVPNKRFRTLSLIAFVLCGITSIYQAFAYYADVNLQKARGGIHWAQEYERKNQPQVRARLLDKALEFVEIGLRYKSYDPRFSEVAGRICMMKDDYKSALEHFDRAIRVDPYNPELWTVQTQCCLNWVHYANNEKVNLDMPAQQVLDLAEKSAENALKYNDKYPDAYEGMARALYFKTLFLRLPENDKRDLYSRAIEYGKKALEHGVKESFSLLQILILCHQGIKDYQGCADFLQRALSIDMENIELWSRYANVMKELGYPPEYLSTLEKVYAKLKKEANRTAPTLAQLGLMIYQENIRRGEATDIAMSVLEDTLRLNPNELSTWGAYIYAVPEGRRLESIRNQVQKLSSATTPLPEILGLISKPEEEINWLYITKEVLNLVNSDEKNRVPYKTQVLRYSWIAEICFSENINSSKGDKPEIYANLIDIYLKLKFQHRALPCFQLAQNVQSNSVRQRVFYLWAETLFKMKKYEDSLEKIRESLKINPEHIQSRVLLVQTLLQLNRFSEANLEFQALKQVLPEDSATMRSLKRMFENRQS
ncbi:MAG: O-antigen ligase family protein [Candidatus Hydrogenedentes bacterium]|nr:O-antigen ligase family protein [Candidatus Hydrogenedentota bacterium]